MGMKKQKKKNPLFILSLVIICSIAIYSFAKYVIEIPDIHIQKAKQFYFESDILKLENPTYLLYDWNGEDTYTLEIDLKNYQDELRYTNDSIEYQINVTSENENINLSTSLQSNAGTLQGGSQTEEKINIYVDSTTQISEGEFVDVLVTANSTSPYEKTLTATFRIYVQKAEKYEVICLEDENLQYVNLYIANKDEDTQITIKYDNTKLILDTNNELLNDIKVTTGDTENEFNFTLERNCNYIIGFIKSNSDTEIVLGTDILIE